MPRTKATARKSTYRDPSPPRPDNYTWLEPRAKCILLDQPSSSLANSRSPKPLFYQPKDSPKTYLIFTPYKKMDDTSTYHVYKYDIKSNIYNKFSQYPKELDIDWPMHFIDHNNDILYVFDSNQKPKNQTKLFWKLNLINGTWTNVEIPITNHINTFKPKSDCASINYSNDNQSVNITYKLLKYRCMFDYFMQSFNFENREFQTIKMEEINAWDEEFEFPNGKYWKSFNLTEITKYNAMSTGSFLVQFDHILFLILWGDGDLVCREETEIWCLSLLDNSNKWHKSAKMLPSYFAYNDPNQYFITTIDGYIHFYHKYFYHTIISLIDLVPKEVKDNIGVKFKKLIFGFIKGEIERKYNLNIPDYLKRLVVLFYTTFQ